jgi:hypothetical protein
MSTLLSVITFFKKDWCASLPNRQQKETDREEDEEEEEDEDEDEDADEDEDEECCIEERLAATA